MSKPIGLLFVLLAIFLTGCASQDNVNEDTRRLALQYATIKALNRADNINPVDVIDAAERFKAGLDGDVQVPVQQLEVAAMEWADEQGLDAADKLLVSYVVEQVVINLNPDGDKQFLDEDARVRLIELMDIIIEAAYIAG